MTDPADTLHFGLRSSWALCEATRADLQTALTAVPSDQWQWQPGPSRWSVAQQADHLLKAEIGTSKLVRRLIRGDYKGLVRPQGAVLYDSTLATYPFGPVAAPPVLQPAGLGADVALQQLAAAHARFREELLRFTAADPDVIAAPDPASDLWFTLAGWVRVQALHEANHVLQIKQLTQEWRA